MRSGLVVHVGLPRWFGRSSFGEHLAGHRVGQVRFPESAVGRNCGGLVCFGVGYVSFGYVVLRLLINVYTKLDVRIYDVRT